MYYARNEINKELAQFLNKARLQSRLTIPEAAKLAHLDPSAIINYETGIPVPVSDYLSMMRAYQMGSMLSGAKIQQLYSKHLDSF